MSNLNQGSLDSQMQLLKVKELYIDNTGLFYASGGRLNLSVMSKAGSIDLLVKKLLTTNAILTNSITEYTPSSGVTIDGVLVKDNEITVVDKLNASKTLTAVDPSANVTNNETLYFPSSSGEVILSAGVANVKLDFTLIDITGTDSLVSDLVQFDFEIQIDGTNWISQSVLTILPASYGSWSNNTFSLYASLGNPVKWRLKLVESGSNGEAYDISSFLPTVKVYVDLT